MTRDYRLCGWRVRSTLPLPELAPWPDDDGRPADVAILEGGVPAELADPVAPGGTVTVGRDGTVLLRIPNLVRLLVRGGSEIRVEILRRETAAGWRLFLLGAGLGYLCHQRGLFPLHAASLNIGGRVVALAGMSGAGKSTLAMALVRRGHSLLSDDLTVLRTAPGEVMVLPAWPRLKLWADALEQFGLAAAGLPRVRDGMDKYDLSPMAAFDPAPMPLGAVVLLDRGSNLSMRRLEPIAAVPALDAFVHRAHAARLLGRRPALLAQAAAIAQSVPVWWLNRPMVFDLLEPAAALTERTLAP